MFRKLGFSAVSVDKLMEKADLTRGGFYAHFKSKDDLIEAILSRNAGLVRMMDEREGKSSKTLNQEALKILGDYLDPKNLDEIVEGCPMATMPVDAARASEKIRTAYGSRFRSLIEQLKRGLKRSRQSEEDAIAAAVLAVGGIIFARASATSEEAAQIESACLKHVARLLKT